MQRYFMRRFKQRTAPGNKRLRILTGFTPTHVRVTQRLGTNPNVYDWFKGMAAGTADQTLGSSGVSTKIGTDGITVGNGYVELGSTSAFQVVDGEYIFEAWADDGDTESAATGLDLDADSDRVGTIPTDTAASFVFTDGQEDDVNWIQREA